MGLPEFMQVIPREQAGVVTVVKFEFDGVITDRIDRADRDIAFAGHCFALCRAMPFDFGARAFDAEILGGEMKMAPVLKADAEGSFVFHQTDFRRPLTI